MEFYIHPIPRTGLCCVSSQHDFLWILREDADRIRGITIVRELKNTTRRDHRARGREAEHHVRRVNGMGEHAARLTGRIIPEHRPTKIALGVEWAFRGPTKEEAPVELLRLVGEVLRWMTEEAA